jgi:hypothetical protein
LLIAHSLSSFFLRKVYKRTQKSRGNVARAFFEHQCVGTNIHRHTDRSALSNAG